MVILYHKKGFEAWALLKHLANLNHVPCVCLGDFNKIVEFSEKWGGSGR
jgi:endonuclease/exonuclease/phosphatase family metal-dependent hydrolase